MEAGATATPPGNPDYQLLEELGSGGMGVVYEARQTAFDRSVAIKMVKPARRGSAAAADALMAEAVVTGHLEHPNVIPVYDLGIDAEGNLFYAMKEVQGFPWSKLMAEKTLDENLDILLRVADTISFAHSRGILHRDLKPHNIMLGEFGETMVMDWGASCAMAGSTEMGALSAESSFCGTPAYMPPEMARGDTNRLGEASDVYLLGAILYQIVSGHPPRREKDPVLCISLAAENHIEPVDDGELLRIAFKAMAAAPADRFRDVREFQQAIRDYRSHSESLLLSENAKAHLASARQNHDYDLFNRAIYGFREALELWPENPDADRLRIEATVEYARCAFGSNDLELAQSLLDPSDPVQRELLDRITKAIHERDAHKKRIRKLLFTARLLGGILLLIFAAAFFLIRSEHRRNLSTLIAAHYGEQNHEATVATFWELHDRYGMEGLDEETLLDVRVAAAMNPWHGSIETGVNDPLKIMPAAEESCVWVVGKREMKKVRLDPAAGYDPETMVSIHDFKFGKRLPPGKVVESIDLPFELASGEAVHEGADGTLWAGSGSALYRKTGASWEPMLEMDKLEYPPLPPEFECDESKRGEFCGWMNSTGLTLRVTGLLLNRAQDRAAVALGGGVVCWIDLAEKKCLGWYFVDMDTSVEASEYGCDTAPEEYYPDIQEVLNMPNGPQLVFSPDERWLLFREGCRETYVFAFELPAFIRKKFFYCGAYPCVDLAFPNEKRCWGLIGFQGVVFSPTTAALSRYWGVFDAWGPLRWSISGYGMRRLPYGNWKTGALAPNGMENLVVTEDDLLVAGSSIVGRGFDFEGRIVPRDWADCGIVAKGVALALSAEGNLHLYNTHAYAMQSLPLNGKVVDICKGHHPDHLFAVLEQSSGKNDIVEIGNIRSATPEIRVVATDTEFAAICCDPLGRWLVAMDPQEGKVIGLADGKSVATITNPTGEVFPVKFDETGAHLICGGNWKHLTKIYRTADWEIAHEEDGGCVDILLHEGHVLEIKLSRLKCRNMGQTNFLWEASEDLESCSIVPFTDPDSGRRLHWNQGWFDEFRAFNASTGEIMPRVSNHWRMKGIRRPVFNQDDNRVLFSTKGGGMEMALRSDLYPVFDSRVVDRKIDKVALNSDASMVAMVSEGELLLMNLSGVLATDPKEETPAHYVSNDGLDIWPYDSWATAAREIHNAVKAAAAGDTVLLDDGTFHIDRSVFVREAITVRSRNGAGKTIVDAGGSARVFELSFVDGPCRIEGITITGGSGGAGGGVFNWGSRHLSIADCVIEGNVAGQGGGIYVGVDSTLRGVDPLLSDEMIAPANLGR